MALRTWRLVGADSRPYESDRPGQFGGHRRSRIYGRLDCRTALAALARGGYATHRVFFPDEATAVSAGYRPCAACMRPSYEAWKSAAAGPGAHAELQAGAHRPADPDRCS